MGKSRFLRIRADHAIHIPQACQPGDWFGAGKAWLAPLYRKRALLIDKHLWVHAWTLYNDAVSTNDWRTPPSLNHNLHYAVDVRGRKPSGWYITLPPELRARRWLPEGPADVVCEYDSMELNFWTEPAFNLEALLEAEMD